MWVYTLVKNLFSQGILDVSRPGSKHMLRSATGMFRKQRYHWFSWGSRRTVWMAVACIRGRYYRFPLSPNNIPNWFCVGPALVLAPPGAQQPYGSRSWILLPSGQGGAANSQQRARAGISGQEGRGGVPDGQGSLIHRRGPMRPSGPLPGSPGPRFQPGPAAVP